MSVRMRSLCAWLASVTGCVGVVLLGCCIPLNQAPVAQSLVVSIAAGGTANITVVATDPDAGPGPLTWTLVTNPTNGTLTGLLPNVTYTPTNPAFTGCDQFTFQASDGAASSNIATVAIAIDNQAPTATDVTVNAAANQTTTLTLAGTDPDGCPLPLTFQIVTPPANGTLGTPSGSTVGYTPNADFVGTDTFTYRAFDGLATSANTATATVIVAITGPTNRNIRLTLQNALTDRYIHYHLHLIAFREDVPVGDESRYASAGYVRYPTGLSFGCYSFTQDLFYYYHQNGRFRTNINDATTTLLSGIAPASSDSVPQLDLTFRNREVPLPSLILFHDPQDNVPAPFNVDRGPTTINPVLDDETNCLGCGICSQSSWYYVNENDQRVGISGLGCTTGRDPADASRIGRYFRVPAETQDTVCFDCLPDFATLPLIVPDTSGAHWLHNTAVGQAVWPNPAGNLANVRCYQYYLGSLITYTFTDAGSLAPPGTSPPPSLKWEVKTTGGTIIHSPS